MPNFTNKAICKLTGQPRSIETLLVEGENWAKETQRSIAHENEKIDQKLEQIQEIESEIDVMRESVSRARRIHDRFVEFFK